MTMTTTMNTRAFGVVVVARKQVRHVVRCILLRTTSRRDLRRSNGHDSQVQIRLQHGILALGTCLERRQDRKTHVCLPLPCMRFLDFTTDILLQVSQGYDLERNVVRCNFRNPTPPPVFHWSVALAPCAAISILTLQGVCYCRHDEASAGGLLWLLPRATPTPCNCLHHPQ